LGLGVTSTGEGVGTGFSAGATGLGLGVTGTGDGVGTGLFGVDVTGLGLGVTGIGVLGTSFGLGFGVGPTGLGLGVTGTGLGLCVSGVGFAGFSGLLSVHLSRLQSTGRLTTGKHVLADFCAGLELPRQLLLSSNVFSDLVDSTHFFPSPLK
jgi:hypothetical protein